MARAHLPALLISLRGCWSAGLLSVAIGVTAFPCASAATQASAPDTLRSESTGTDPGVPEASSRTDRAPSHQTHKYPSGFVVWKFGGYVPDTKDLPDAKAKFGLDLGLGVQFSPLLGIEFSIGEHTVDVPTTILGATTQLPMGVYPITISEVVIHRSRIGNLPAGVYALGGPGLYLTTLGDEDHVGTGLQAGVGAYLWLLGVEGRYVWATTKIGTEDISINGFFLSVNGGVH